jgi:hypothetical protein
MDSFELNLVSYNVEFSAENQSTFRRMCLLHLNFDQIFISLEDGVDMFLRSVWLISTFYTRPQKTELVITASVRTSDAV